jgi:hypothetical protein
VTPLLDEALLVLFAGTILASNLLADCGAM